MSTLTKAKVQLKLCKQTFWMFHCAISLFRQMSLCLCWDWIDELISTDGLSLGKQNAFGCSFLFVLVGQVKGSIMYHSPPMSYCTFCGMSVTANCTTGYLPPPLYLKRNGLRRHSLVPWGKWKEWCRWSRISAHSGASILVRFVGWDVSMLRI